MNQYLSIAEQLPLPTVEQTKNFVAHVARAHSWYKHLPLIPPGAPFVFFLDPNAGRSISQTWRRDEHPGGPFPESFAETKPRMDEMEVFAALHSVRGSLPMRTVIEDITDRKDSRMLTRDYRERFGYWEYSQIHWNDMGKRNKPPSIYASEVTMVELPDQILQQCVGGLTAFVHNNPPRRRDTLEFLFALLGPSLEYAREHAEDPRMTRYRPLLGALEKVDARDADKNAEVWMVFRENHFQIECRGKGVFVSIERIIGSFCEEERAFQRELLQKALLRSREVFAKLLHREA